MRDKTDEKRRRASVDRYILYTFEKMFKRENKTTRVIDHRDEEVKGGERGRGVTDS